MTLLQIGCPRVGDLPERRFRMRRGGPEVATLRVRLELVTPVLGGAAVPRTIDEIDTVRVPSIRGQLRFWWRALHAHRFDDSKALWEAESALFGRAADEGGGRSPVEVRVSVEKSGDVDPDDIQLYPKAGKPATPGAYALFPARAETGTGAKAAPRRKPGTTFTLELRGPGPVLNELHNVLRAWILFGGYGSRTRRGLGSLTVPGDDGKWLPKEPNLAELRRLLGDDVFAPASRAATETPRLAGASLLVGQSVQNAEAAWTTALGWLRDFRQGTSGESGKLAREPGAGGRPSISNWPEADKIRHLSNKIRSHKPRYGRDPAWPRASFGLPIVGQFQTHARDGGRYDEPGAYEINWKQGNEPRNRLASPLIVKAMPLADGKFV
ncbi:MAG: type III-B CRISPR module RAMP protein Cmr1, partial [Geminicoccaceae bacterium]|nr:type III-B CRISPR module RAMP protein Cmr1 [Geminicoccaceae bacterium]